MASIKRRSDGRWRARRERAVLTVEQVRAHAAAARAALRDRRSAGQAARS